jgi:hypothetical protein
VVGRFESYARAAEGAEPCESLFLSSSRYPDSPVGARTELDIYAAWSVSLNPNGETYAATGGSGNVVVYSAKADTFGQRVASLASGRSKYGMYCEHVRCCPYFMEPNIFESDSTRARAEPGRQADSAVDGDGADIRIRRGGAGADGDLHVARAVGALARVVRRLECASFAFFPQTADTNALPSYFSAHRRTSGSCCTTCARRRAGRSRPSRGTRRGCSASTSRRTGGSGSQGASRAASHFFLSSCVYVFF